MKLKEKYCLELQEIGGMLTQLKNGQIYEADPVPGNPKCSTIGANLQQKLEELLYKIENDRIGNIEVAAAILDNQKEDS